VSRLETSKKKKSCQTNLILVHICSSGFGSRQGQEFFLFASASRPALDSTSASYPIGKEGSSPGVKVANHFSLSIADVKNVWSYTSTSPYVFTAWWLIKHSDNFTFLPEYGHEVWNSVGCALQHSLARISFAYETGYKARLTSIQVSFHCYQPRQYFHPVTEARLIQV